MNDITYNFVLVGTRFNRLIIDEGNLGEPDDGELAATIRRRMGGVVEHTYDDRAVIEISVGIVVKDTGNDQVIVDIECTGGFVGATSPFDGDLKEFKKCRDYLARSLYWVVRSRLQTLAATTLVNLSPLPWDYSPSNSKSKSQESFRDGAEEPKVAPKGRVKKVTKAPSKKVGEKGSKNISG